MGRKTPPVRGTLYLSVLRSQHPVGMTENSPVIHHRVNNYHIFRSPVGTIEIGAECCQHGSFNRPYGTLSISYLVSPAMNHRAIFVPSLRDLIGAISNRERAF